MRPARRARKQWREGAPPYVLDCFDDPEYADRYTVFFVQVDEGIVSYLGMSDTPTSPQGFSQWGELDRSQAAAFRYRSGKKRIKWSDLPLNIRVHVIARYTEV